MTMASSHEKDSQSGTKKSDIHGSIMTQENPVLLAEAWLRSCLVVLGEVMTFSEEEGDVGGSSVSTFS